MDLDTLYLTPVQPTFLEVIETTSGLMELFPAVWSAAEGLTSPDVHIRNTSLKRLLELGAPRISPLISYLLATCIPEPDLPLRCRIVRTLGELLVVDEAGRQAPNAVRRHMVTYLAQMRTRPVFCLLQASIAEPNLEAHVTRLLNNCPHAGTHLAEIFSNRGCPWLYDSRQYILLDRPVFWMPCLPLNAWQLAWRRGVTGSNLCPSLPLLPHRMKVNCSTRYTRHCGCCARRESIFPLRKKEGNSG